MGVGVAVEAVVGAEAGVAVGPLTWLEIGVDVAVGTVVGASVDVEVGAAVDVARLTGLHAVSMLAANSFMSFRLEMPRARIFLVFMTRLSVEFDVIM
jgi:hypothetical protein